MKKIYTFITLVICTLLSSCSMNTTGKPSSQSSSFFPWENTYYFPDGDKSHSLIITQGDLPDYNKKISLSTSDSKDTFYCNETANDRLDCLMLNNFFTVTLSKHNAEKSVTVIYGAQNNHSSSFTFYLPEALIIDPILGTWTNKSKQNCSLTILKQSDEFYKISLQNSYEIGSNYLGTFVFSLLTDNSMVFNQNFGNFPLPIKIIYNKNKNIFNIQSDYLSCSGDFSRKEYL